MSESRGNEKARAVAKAVGLRLLPYGLPLLLSLGICWWCTGAILARAESPALALDDSFIHLQFARRIAEGHWFSYTQGGGYSSGATSMLWPLCIAPFAALGVRGLNVVYVVWALGCLLHAAVALETARVAARLGGRWTGAAAGLACFAFGGFAWFAYSGMETIAATWILIRGVRVAAERAEPNAERCFTWAPRVSLWSVALTGLCAPLIRPEGAAVSVIAALAIAQELRAGFRLKTAVAAVVPLCGPLVIPFQHWWFTGHSSSSTAMVKWLALDPYVDRQELIDSTLSNVNLLATDLLNGGRWTSLFVPEGMAYALLFGVFALAFAAWRQKRPWSAAFVVLLVLATMGPCTYSTILWNRVRYIWPFAPAWFVAIAVGGNELGEFLGRRVHHKAKVMVAVLTFGAVAPLFEKLPDSVADVANSSRAIHLQQVKLGQWARDALPQDAVIGVNDTGAIAYFSDRKTFDVVGLTTEGEAPFWAEGAGARFEHYENLGGASLPTHFIVYPGWMAMDAVLGKRIFEASVYEQSILGGTTKVAYEARYDALGTGARPAVGVPGGKLIDELDVADVKSEVAHFYERGDARARFSVARVERDALAGTVVADGGRIQRAEERFVMREGPAAKLVMRLRCGDDVVVFHAAARLGVAKRLLAGREWDEYSIALPPSEGSRWITVRCQKSKARLERFDSYHYWLFAE